MNWTKNEIKHLLHMADNGAPSEHMSRIIKKTTEAVDKKLHTLKVKREELRKLGISPQILITKIKKHRASINCISKEMGISYQALYGYIRVYPNVEDVYDDLYIKNLDYLEELSTAATKLRAKSTTEKNEIINAKKAPVKMNPNETYLILTPLQKAQRELGSRLTRNDRIGYLLDGCPVKVIDILKIIGVTDCRFDL